MTHQQYFKEHKIIPTYILLLIVSFVFLWLINYFNISYPLSVTTKTSNDLAIVGVGKVDVVPNSANVSIGVVANNAKTVQDAQNQISKVNNSIIDALTRLGIAKKDITTSNYSITPNYNYQNGTNEINGYNGNATLSVKVTDTSKLTDIISTATNEGASEILNTTYSVENPEKYQEQARNLAIANARQQAQKLATQLGIHLGKVVNIVESSDNSSPVPPVPMFGTAQKALAPESASANLESGTQTITSTVTLYFEKR